MKFLLFNHISFKQEKWNPYFPASFCHIFRRKIMGKKKVNRKYKDTVFRLLFGKNRKELLALYNAVNDTHYTNEEDLEINTLEEAIYVGMRNDISFVFRDELNLYEHQSTLSPNLPLRDLFYVADLLQDMTCRPSPKSPHQL